MPGLTLKAWAVAKGDVGNTLLRGMGIASVSKDAGKIMTFVFTVAMPNTEYFVIVRGGIYSQVFCNVTKSTDNVKVACRSSDWANAVDYGSLQIEVWG